jgi:hypothetical protein
MGLLVRFAKSVLLVDGNADGVSQRLRQPARIDVGHLSVDRRQKVALKLERELALHQADEMRRRDEHPSTKARRSHRLVERLAQRVGEARVLDLFG